MLVIYLFIFLFFLFFFSTCLYLFTFFFLGLYHSFYLISLIVLFSLFWYFLLLSINLIRIFLGVLWILLHMCPILALPLPNLQITGLILITMSVALPLQIGLLGSHVIINFLHVHQRKTNLEKSPTPIKPSEQIIHLSVS